MKKFLLSIAIVAAGLFVASCGNKGGATAADNTEFATDTLTFDDYKWFTWKAIVPEGKGYKMVPGSELPEVLRDYSNDGIQYLVGDKVLVYVGDFYDKSLDGWKTNSSYKPEELEETKIAGRNALRARSIESDGQTTKFWGYTYYVDSSDFGAAGYEHYKSFTFSVYSADGKYDVIDSVLADEQVQFILDNMTVTPKSE